MRNWKSLVLLSFLLLQPAIANAGILMAFTGTSGSSEITLTMSGTSTLSSFGIGGFGTSFGFSPQDWFTETEFDRFGGLRPKHSSRVNLSSNLEFRNASDNALRASFNRIQGINGGNGGDGWSLGATDRFSLSVGDTVTALGSATFTLGNGFTIGSIANGTYIGSPFNSFPVTMTWNASPVAAVPEPSSVLILALGSVVMGLYRVRRQRPGVTAPDSSAAV